MAMMMVGNQQPMMAQQPMVMAIGNGSSIKQGTFQTEWTDCCAPPGGCGRCFCVGCCAPCTFGKIVGQLPAGRRYPKRT